MFDSMLHSASQNSENQFSYTYSSLAGLLTEWPSRNDCQCKDQSNDTCRAIKNHRSDNTSAPHSLHYYVGEKTYTFE